MMRTVHLHGSLKKQFGASHRFEVSTAAEAVRALNVAFPRRWVKALERGSFRLVRGDKSTGMSLDLDLVTGLKLGNADLHIIPVARGANNNSAKGTGKVILGAALIGAAIFMSGGTLAAPLAATGMFSGITYGNIAMLGLGLALTGASTLLAKSPSSLQAHSSNSLSVSNGNIGNSGRQGDAITLIYGNVVTGSMPVSVKSDIEDIDVYADASGSIEETFNGPAYGGPA